MFPGYKFTIENETYTVPALSMGQLRNGIMEKLKSHDTLLTDGKIFELQLLRSEIILAAIRRNYPDFPEDKLLNFLDMANIGPVWSAVLGSSGFAPGETPAATTKESGT
jgi:hypothetical protein